MSLNMRDNQLAVADKSARRTRVAVIGLGQIGLLHAVTYSSMPDVSLVGLVEPDEGKHAELRREFGVSVERTFDFVEPLVDAVSICTPEPAHVDVAVRALDAGKFVLVEKPLAVNVVDAARILASRPSTRRLTVGHILRFDPRVQKCRDAVRSGKLGRVWHVEVWRSTTRETGRRLSGRTSVAWFLGVHDADLVRYVTGLEVIAVHGTGQRLFSRHYDVIYGQLELTDGVVGSMFNSWALPDARPSRALAGLRVVGSEGMIEVELGHHDILLSTNHGATFLDSWFWPDDSVVRSHNLRRELEAFVEASRADGPSPVTGEDGLAAVRIIEGLERSIHSHQTTRIGVD